MSRKREPSTKSVSKKNIKTENKKDKQSRLLQTTCPSVCLEDALIIPRAIKENFAGHATAPLLVADACGISPASSKWRIITGASIAYGLTDGAYNAKEISLTPLGERIVAPLVEGDEEIALKEAVLKPSFLLEFYTKYNNNKLPEQKIVLNVLQKIGIPNDRTNDAWNILRTNAKKANILRVISGSEYIFIDKNGASTRVPQSNSPTLPVSGTDSDEIQVESIQQYLNNTTPLLNKEKPKVFISHGKNTLIVEQIKQLLIFGQMEPVVSIERETTAISVPDKVFDDMRDCDAAIINIDLEEISHSDDKQEQDHLNENVLIEIGAAIALYGKRVVFLCKKGTKLPSNLQGLYRCEYEGTQLDYGSTMKLLKTMQDLREKM